MCWSLEVSVVAGTAVLLAVVFLFLRRGPRDRHNAIFLLVFGSMQWVEAGLWYVQKTEDFEACLPRNEFMSRAAYVVVMMEPFASLFGRGNVAWWELAVYVVCGVLLPCSQSVSVVMDLFGNSSPCKTSSSCSVITRQGHLMSCPGFVPGTRPPEVSCWRSDFFSERSFQAEIPTVFRVWYLLGMAYPYLFQKPLAAGCLQAAVLMATWTYAFLFSDSHQSSWCLANVLQIISMLLDPYIFKSTSSDNKSKPKQT